MADFGFADSPASKVEYHVTSAPKTTEKNFENDVESIMHDAGWDVFESNAEAQADYDRFTCLNNAWQGALPS